MTNHYYTPKTDEAHDAAIDEATGIGPNLPPECPDCWNTGVVEGELCPLCRGRSSADFPRPVPTDGLDGAWAAGSEVAL